jgi:hypothetical protein
VQGKPELVVRCFSFGLLPDLLTVVKRWLLPLFASCIAVKSMPANIAVLLHVPDVCVLNLV